MDQAKNGLVDLHVLKDRNFRTGCFLIALLGMCIYITIAILPLYYQEVLGYTAFTAGLVVGPRGIGSFIGSPVIGILGSRIDNRKLLCAGFLGFGICSLIFGTVNLDIGPYTLLIPIMLTGLRPELRLCPPGHHDHLHHLRARRWATPPASSTCCATSADPSASPWPPRRSSAAPRSTRPNSAPTWRPSNPILQQKSAAIAGYLGHQLGRAQGRPGSMGMLYGLMQQQSALLAYVDVFRWTAVLAFFCAGAVWLFKKPDKHAAPPPGVH